MMEARIIGYDGSQAELPQVRRWKMEYAAGTPCDSFEIECLWDGGEPDGILSRGNRMHAWWKGGRVFTGVVDEFECRADSGGSTLTVSGRGMAALLLDNESRAQQYQAATLEDILRDHVAPYGIRVAEQSRLPEVYGFQVVGGSSEWQVLDDFARKHGGVMPRFDREGRLVLSPWPKGERKVIDSRAGVLELRWGERRYGVLSEVLVRNPGVKDETQIVKNQVFSAAGGQCRRVLTMPRKSGYRAMQCRGEYQISRSMEQWKWAQVKLNGVFQAWPGDVVELNLQRPWGKGRWQVRETATGVEDSGGYTTLRLQALEVS